MDGTIGVESAPGQGSMFWLNVALPRGASPATSAAVIPSSETRPLKILLVDDAEMNRRLASLMLKGAGHVVDTANHGRAAIEAVQRTDYDLVLMDVQMPEMDGYEAATRIRTLAPPKANVPIVAMTANAMPEDIQRCLQAGMNAHLSKPIEKPKLLAAAAQWGLANDAP